MRCLRPAVLLASLTLLALPAAGHAATVSVSGSTLTYDAAPGETNTAVIVRQGLGSYFVGDQSPGITVMNNAPLQCLASSVLPGLPPGFLCAVPGATNLVENLGDGNDTGVISSVSGDAAGAVNGEAGDDTLVGGQENDTFQGGAGTDSVAYVGIPAASLTRTAGVGATLPAFPAGAATTGNGQPGESDTIGNDVEGLIGGNGNDTLVGNDGPNVIVGAAPPGTPGGVTSSPAGNDTIDGRGGADSVVAGDSGSVDGGAGPDNVVGGRSTAATTVLHGGDGNDTVVSGLGNDTMFGDGGSNTLAYASVVQGGLTIVNRGGAGVTATLPSPGQTTPGGRTGGAERDVIGPGFGTLVGSNGDDVLTGSSGNDILVGVAPAGTAGVAPGPPGNDRLIGGAGVDVLLGAAGNDRLDGGPGLDVFTAGAGNDTLLSRDSVVETPSCGAGFDVITADATDKPAADCERVTTGLAAKDRVKPRLTQRSSRLVLRKGRRVAFYLACRNEKKGCRGTFTLTTRKKVKLGKRKARVYRLGKASFRITGKKPKRFTLKLSRTTLRVVRRHRAVKLTGTLIARDSSGNRASRKIPLRLKRP